MLFYYFFITFAGSFPEKELGGILKRAIAVSLPWDAVSY